MSISHKSKDQGLLCHLFIVQDSPQLCKTKKGPPMDGTACGKEKWCVHVLHAGQCAIFARIFYISHDGQSVPEA